MSQERSEAVVLRGVDFGESSRIVTFLSPGRGRMACLAKGVKRRGQPGAAALDTFNRVEVVYYWKDGRGVQTLGEVSVLEAYRGLKSDLERGAYAAFPLELAGKVAHENEPSEALYAALVNGLDGLNRWTGDVRTHAAWQVFRLLAAAGFEPRLDVEMPGARLGFSYGEGVTGPGEPADRVLSPAAHAALCALRDAEDACPGVTAPAEVFYVLTRFAAHQLDTDFRSVRVIADMFGRTTEGQGRE